MTAPEPRLMPPCTYVPPDTPEEQLPTAYQVLDGLAVHVHDLSVLVNGKTAAVPQVPGTYTAP